VIDVNTVRLSRGRVIHLMGVEGTAHWDSVHSEQLAAGEMLWAIVEVDTPLVRKLEEKIDRYSVALEFVKFEPDTASADLHAYLIADGEDIGAWMIANGFATVDGNVEHERKQQYIELQQQAEASQLGVWEPEKELPVADEQPVRID